MSRKSMWIVLIIAVLVGMLVAYITADIGKKKGEQSAIDTSASAGLSDNDPRLNTWGAKFPDYLDMYLSGANATPASTDFGGNLSYNKLDRFPQLVKCGQGIHSQKTSMKSATTSISKPIK